MSRIEKFVVIVLSVLSLAFLGQIVGSSKSQNTSPVTAQAAPTTNAAAPRTAPSKLPTVLNAHAEPAPDSKATNQLSDLDQLDLDNMTSQELIKVLEDVCTRANNLGRHEIARKCQRKLNDARYEVNLLQQNKEANEQRRELNEQRGALCNKMADEGFYRMAKDCYREVREGWRDLRENMRDQRDGIRFRQGR